MRGLRRATLTLLALAMAAGCGGEPPLTPEEMVEAFIGRISAGDKTYHAEMHMEMRSGQAEMGPFSTVVSGTINVAGQDYHMAYAQQMSVDGVEPLRIEVVRAGGRLFYRDALSGTWSRGEDGVLIGSSALDPFGGLTAEDVEYVGPDDSLGEGLHRLTARAPDAALSNVLGVPDDTDVGITLDPGSTMDYYVDATGTPSAAIIRIAGSSSSFGESMSFSMAIEYGFSAWGEPITIIAPPVR